ncbi:VOC family protein [Massilia glaciei]|uniref:VOC family protein n=1 Tax=Massilia glaciei TaxID=1524097 RepID=A0A2U2HKG6_9BURK|nr:VOC family protein [Massilia glaciei]PWF47926.1 VOC family protein [Massilia glaciei]
MSTNVKPIPEGMHSITPHIVCAGAESAMDFYIKAFGAIDGGRLKGTDGKLMHGEIRIGDSSIMLVDENPEWNMRGPLALGGTPITLHMYVENVDAAFERAVAAGCAPTMPVADMFWGDRYGMVTDPYGHMWSIATHIRDVAPDELEAAMMQGCGPEAT